MKQDLSSLNLEQRQAVTATQGAVLVLAGAGSGKTRVITTRIAYLINEKKVAPESILAVTFTNKAAREMAARVGKMIKGKKERPLLSTFHAFGVRLLREHIDKLDYSTRFVIYDDQDQQAVVRSLLEEGDYEDGLISWKDAHFALQNAKGRGVTAAELLSHHQDPRDMLLGKLTQEYSEAMQRMNAIDFEDILLLSMRLVREFPAEAAHFFSRFRYVMVDEYQDTNRTQYDLIRAVVRPHGNVCVVGDDDQSIYAWRGAEPGNILDFERDYPGTKVIRLEQNYRSTATILNAANHVIRNNTVRKRKTLRSTKGPGKPLEWLLGEGEREEMEKVVTHLRLTKIREGLDWSNFAVLYRSNHQSRGVEEVLREEGIPYQLLGGTRFFDRREIKDALAYLRLIHNPLDEVSLMRVLNFPKRGIGKASQMKLLEYAQHQQQPVFQVLREAEMLGNFPPATATSMTRFAELIDGYRTRFDNEPLGTTFRELMGDLDFARAVGKEKSDAKTADRAMGLIHELEFAVEQFEVRKKEDPKNATLRKYLEHIALLTLPEDPEDERRPPQVTLMTVHSAKGLEFPHVYLVNLADDLFPHKRSIAEGGEEEERRLFYVAMTRAREQLVLSMARKRKRWGETVPQNPSRFLMEIPENLFDGNPPGLESKASPAQKAKKVLEARGRFMDQMKKMREAPAGDTSLDSAAEPSGEAAVE